MSNFSFSFFQDLCSLKFLKSSDLQKTSLCPPQRRPLEIQQNDPDLESNYSKKESGESKSITRAPSKKGTGTAIQGDVEKVSVTEKDFRIMQVLKSGTNFRTYMVKKESDDALYAMKLMGRRKMEKKCFNEQVKTEKEIMEKAKTPFIPRLLWYFENDKKIFFVMDYVEGETLSQMLQKLSRFSEEMTRFFAAEVLLTLEYLHKELGVSYGNLKLENILLDAQGHIKVLDFTQAKSFVSQEAEETSQSNCSETHKETGSQEMEDFVALGHLIYKLLTGKSLTVAEESEEAAEITSPKFSPRSKLSWPSSISKTAKDLISRLINKDNEEKPSINTIAEIKQHAFFSQVNWEKMSTLSVYPPLIPSHHKENNKDLDDFDDEIEASLPKLSTKTSLMRPSLGGSSEDFDAISYDRATCMNSLLGYR